MRALRGYTVDWPHALAVLAMCNESTSAPPTLNGTIELSLPPSLTLRNMPFLCKYLIRRLSYHKTWWYEWSVWPMHSLTIAIGVTYKAIRWMVNLVLEEVILKSWPVWPVHSLTIAIGVTYKAIRWTVSLVSEEVILKSWRGTNFENTAKEYKRWSEISPEGEPQRDSHSGRATVREPQRESNSDGSHLGTD